MGGRVVLGLALMLAALVAAPSAFADPVSMCNVPIPMSDGTVLRANVFLPKAGARFPTALTVTGYNKDVGNPVGSNCSPSSGLVQSNPKLLDAGYAVMILDDRGTGASEGTWDSWGQRTQDDYAEVLDWLQRQPWSDGSAVTTGASYMGITSLLVAEADAKRVAEGKPRAVKAVWIDVPMADAYRDVTFHGGSVDAGFIPLWLGLTSSLSDIPPSNLVSDPASAAPTYAGHLANTFGFAGQKILDTEQGGDSAYDGPFYRLRSPIERIASLRIPVAWTGGWWDLFQRGEPLLYEEMANSPDKVFFMTPNYHSSPDATAWAQQGYGDEDTVMLRWFDRWVKGAGNGADRMAPVNLYTMGSNQWQHLRAWPLPDTQYTPYFLGDGTSLAPQPPAAPGGDTRPVLPASSPCSRLSAQWTAGAARGPCETDNRTYEATNFTYTSAPLTRDTEATGLLSADIWAELSGASDATLVAVVSDVDPSGQSTQVTSGFLLASQRAVDRGKSTMLGGYDMRPWHPFTRASQQPVPPNDPQRYQIEIYPTSQVFKKGHRIRLTIGTANTPGTAAPLPDQLNQTGGQITLLRGGRYASSVILPLRGAGAAAVNALGLPRRRACVGPRRFSFRIHQHGKRITAVRAYVGRRLVRRMRGRRITRVTLTGLPRGRFTVKVVATTSGGQKVTSVRTYEGCAKSRPRTHIRRAHRHRR